MTDPTCPSEVLTATVRIRATPEEVFPYFVEPELLVQWIGTWADLRPEPGGIFALDMGDVAVRGTFVAVEPPERVVFTWGVPGRDSLPPGSTTVEVRLRADGDETIVELLHHDLPAEARPSHQTGWDSQLATLVGVAQA
jgi:uncharacterized protein YndB with AHSA1/START domain